MSHSPAPSSVFSLTFPTESSTGRLHDSASALSFRKTRSGSRSRSRVPSSSASTSKTPQHSRLEWKKILSHFTCFCLAVGAGINLASTQSEHSMGTKTGFGYGTQYLTILGLIMTIAMFLLALVVDFTHSARTQRIKDTILPIIVTTECAVGFLYWSLVTSNVYHIYPDGNRYIPFWIDIQVHGLPFFYTFCEMFFVSESFQVRRRADYINLTMFAVFYICWSSFCAYQDEAWPYPVLQNITSPWRRLQMMTFCGLLCVCAHVIIVETHIAFRARAAARADAKALTEIRPADQ